MNADDFVTTYFQTRHQRDQAVGQALAGIGSNLVHRVTALARHARLLSSTAASPSSYRRS